MNTQYTVAVMLISAAIVGCSKNPKIQTIPINSKSGYEVRILGEAYWEYQESFYYEVWKHGGRISGPTFFDAGVRQKYSITEASDGKSVSLIEPSSPQPLAVISLEE
jgi:hypothetical protein